MLYGTLTGHWQLMFQILESERQAKWHYVQQTEELATEVKKLKAEVCITNTEGVHTLIKNHTHPRIFDSLMHSEDI